MNTFKIEIVNANDDCRYPLRSRYFAREVDGDPDVFRCAARDGLFYTASQLCEWAELVDCELVFIRWIIGEMDAV